MVASGGQGRVVYVISDLHLGGAPPEDAPGDDAPGDDAPGDDADVRRRRRGFRMMKQPAALAAFVRALCDDPRAELVINGDFVDFLAEAEGDGSFVPFRATEADALAVFRRVAGQIDAGGVTRCEEARRGWDPLVFDALRDLVGARHRLTILLGNHDLELTYPSVREELFRRLGPGDISFRYDDEALAIGPDVLIEHGNLYDRANVVDHGALRKHRAEVSRGMRGRSFTPPVGSRIVAELMNPIKAQYPFIDLLKPESDALFALLLVLEPALSARIGALLATLGGLPVDSVAKMRGAPTSAQTTGGRTLRVTPRADAQSAASAGPDPCAGLFEELFAKDASALLGVAPATRGPAVGGSATRSARGWLASKKSLLDVAVAGAWMGDEARLDALARTIRALSDDQSFRLDGERRSYAEWAARSAREGGYRCVVFGHTHLAKDQSIAIEGAPPIRYLNSGTWASLMQFPLLTGDDDRGVLARFVDEVRRGDIDHRIQFRPTFVRLEMDAEDRLVDAGVFEHGPAGPRRLSDA